MKSVKSIQLLKNNLYHLKNEQLIGTPGHISFLKITKGKKRFQRGKL